MFADQGEIIDKIAAIWGIEPEYTDIWGKHHPTSRKTKLAILRALGLRTGNLQEELSRLAGRRFLEPVLVRSRRTLSRGFSIYLPSPPRNLSVKIEASGDRGIIWERRLGGEVLSSRGMGSYDLPLPADLPLGYYQLKVATTLKTASSLLIVPPETTYLPEFLRGKGRTWGIFLPLYALRSAGNWGIGDLRDLRELLNWMGRELKVGFVGINPLHAVKNKRPYNLSPYYPSSRIYRNFIYLNLEEIPEFKRSPEAQRMVAGKEFQRDLAALRASALVDYERVASLKLRVLELLFKLFQGVESSRRAQEFSRYREREGEGLEEYATFQALSEHFLNRSWAHWPQEFQNPQSEEVKSFQKSHQQRILLFEYIQWNVEEQLAEIREASHKAGIPLGLYEDLALGVEGGGADAWSNQGVYAFQAELGAPPDEFFPLGQRWGLPPVIPQRLREEGYRPWIHLLRHNLPPGGALRIDHVMGLFHSFWIPQGMAPQEGAYVRGYPGELLGILALESHLHRTLIVGEDLGTVPPWIRTELANWGVLSTKVLYFEREADQGPTPPARYPPLSLAGINTHDMPTLKGFWQLRDIEWRERLGLYPSPKMAEEERTRREGEKGEILQALKSRGFHLSGSNWDLDLLRAVVTWLALTPCKLLVLNIWDLLGEGEQQNLPGTVGEYPNWSRKLSPRIEKIIGDQRIRELAHLLDSLGRGKR